MVRRSFQVLYGISWTRIRFSSTLSWTNSWIKQRFRTGYITSPRNRILGKDRNGTVSQRSRKVNPEEDRTGTANQRSRKRKSNPTIDPTGTARRKRQERKGGNMAIPIPIPIIRTALVQHAEADGTLKCHTALQHLVIVHQKNPELNLRKSND